VEKLKPNSLLFTGKKNQGVKQAEGLKPPEEVDSPSTLTTPARNRLHEKENQAVPGIREKNRDTGVRQRREKVVTKLPLLYRRDALRPTQFGATGQEERAAWRRDGLEGFSGGLGGYDSWPGRHSGINEEKKIPSIGLAGRWAR